MKTLVIYTSQTGFTKKYAEWISEELKADIYDLKDAKKKPGDFFKAYDAIIYAGWCMAGTVVKVKWFLENATNWKGKKLAVVMVGASPNESNDVEVALKNVLTDEQRQYMTAFYCQGGIDYDKLPLPSRTTLKMFSKFLKNKKDASEELKEMAEYISHSYDISDRKYIDPIVSYVRGN